MFSCPNPVLGSLLLDAQAVRTAVVHASPAQCRCLSDHTDGF